MVEFDNENQRDRYNSILRFLSYINQSPILGSSQPNASDALMKEIANLQKMKKEKST